MRGCLLVLVLVSVHPYVLSVRHWWKVTCDVGYLVKQIILKEFGECCHNFSLNLGDSECRRLICFVVMLSHVDVHFTIFHMNGFD